MSANPPADQHRRLVDRYLDELASPEEVEELNRLLRERDEVAGYFVRTARLNSLLREHAREAAAVATAAAAEAPAAQRRISSRRRRAVSSRVAPASERRQPGSGRFRAASSRRGAVSERRGGLSGRRVRRGRNTWILPALAAAAAVILLAVFMPRGGGPVRARAWNATVSGFRGRPQIYRGTEPLQTAAGLALLPGDRVLTDEGSTLSLEYEDGTAVDVNRGSRLTLDGERLAKRMTLDSGAVFAAVARQPAGYPLVVNPGRYDQVTVVGTRLEVSWGQRATLLRVAEGRALLGSGEDRVEVGGLEYSGVERGGRPSAPLPVAASEIAAWRANRPPVAQGANLEAPGGGVLAVKLAGEDPDGDHLEFRIESEPAHGKLSGSPPDLAYQPAAGYAGPDAFTFSAGDGKARSETAQVVIAVRRRNAPPTAVIVAEPRQGRAPLRVIFNGMESSDPDGKIVSYAWEFGDGSKGDGVEVAHVYQRPGKYGVKLTVRDADGGIGARETLIEVVDPDFVAAPTRFRWHYHKEKGSYYSWQDNSDNEGSFEIERAHDPTQRGGPDLVWEVIEETPANTTLIRTRYRGEKMNEWYRYRVRAVGRGKRSEPSNSRPNKWGGEGADKDQINWPPPGYTE
jgi:hypothetical protein